MLKSFIGQDQIWRQLRTMILFEELRPVLFLDRDGVVVEEVDYLHRVADVRFIKGIVDTVVVARQAGWRIAMVTNQAGIARGIYDWGEFAVVNEYILAWLDSKGAIVDVVLATPHHPEGLGIYQHTDHPMRKPNPGMLLDATKILNGDVERSLIVGDNVSDLMAGQRAGLRQGFAVMTGHGSRYRQESEALASSVFSVCVIDDVGDANLRHVLASNG